MYTHLYVCARDLNPGSHAGTIAVSPLSVIVCLRKQRCLVGASIRQKEKSSLRPLLRLGTGVEASAIATSETPLGSGHVLHFVFLTLHCFLSPTFPVPGCYRLDLSPAFLTSLCFGHCCHYRRRRLGLLISPRGKR